MTAHEQVSGSLASAQQALEQLRQGLRDGGFDDALDTYRSMAEIITAQRLVSRVHGDSSNDPSFRAIGDIALEIRELLAPWLGVMDMLTCLDATADALLPSSDPERADQDEPAAAEDDLELSELETTVLVWLRDNPGPQVTSRVAAHASAATREVAAALQGLVDAGLVGARPAGRRERWEALSDVLPRPR